MKIEYFALTALLGLFLMVSSVSALSTSSVNMTNLIVWDVTDNSLRYILERVDFHANYTFTKATTTEFYDEYTDEQQTETEYEAVPITSGVCTIRDGAGFGLWSDPVKMSYDSGTKTYTHSKYFANPGVHQFEVGCSASGYPNVTVIENFVVAPYPDRECGVDVYGLNVVNRNVVANVRNTGNWLELVTYNLSLNNNEALTGSVVVEPDKTFTFDDYRLGTGNYKIRFTAETDCFSSDYERMEYSYTELTEYTCKNPYGIEGQNMCDHINKRVLVCDDGDWEECDLIYEYNCLMPGTCRTGYLDSYMCEGDWLQKERQNDDCSREWVNYIKCEHGCSSGACRTYEQYLEDHGRCDIRIASVDYSNNLMEDEEAYITVVIGNTGERRTEVSLKFKLDGKTEGSYSQPLGPGQDFTKRFYYTPEAGTHSVSLIADGGCDSDNANLVVNALKRVEYTHKEPEPDVFRPETRVTIVPDSLDIEQYKAKIIEVGIQTSKPQLFELTVSGVPSDWLGYERYHEVEGFEKAHIYVSPKALGSYEISVRVEAQGEDYSESSTIDLFVAGGSAETRAVYDEVLAQSSVYLMEPQNLFLAAMLTFLFVFCAGAWKLREEGIA